MNDMPSSRRAAGALPADIREVSQCVTFFDLSRMMEWASNQEDRKVAAMFQEFYQLAADSIEGAGGRIVKFIGDAGMAVFPKEAADRVIPALADLAVEVRKRAAAHGFDTYLNTNVHFGPMLEGSFGPKGLERYDVIGKTVNIAARLGRRGLTLSQQAYRCLSPAVRERFSRIDQPTNYRLSR
jgi:adenylate cyclase